jgi:hypothetical protein
VSAVARVCRDLAPLTHRTELDTIEARYVAERVTDSSSRIACREAEDLAERAGRRLAALRARRTL